MIYYYPSSINYTIILVCRNYFKILWSYQTYKYLLLWHFLWPIAHCHVNFRLCVFHRMVEQYRPAMYPTKEITLFESFICLHWFPSALPLINTCPINGLINLMIYPSNRFLLSWVLDFFVQITGILSIYLIVVHWNNAPQKYTGKCPTAAGDVMMTSKH